MRKKILQKAIISYLILILSISVFPVIEADTEQYFTEQDCECGGLEMVLEESTADPYGGNRLTCSYSKGETGTIELEAIYYQNGGAADGFNTRLDWVEWMLESPERVQIFDSEISDDRCFYTQRKPTTQIGFDLVERHQTVLYKENYVIKIDGSDSIDLEGEYYVSFGDYEEFVKAFDDLENCIKDVIDSRDGDQDIAKVLKGRITTSDVPRNFRELYSSANIDDLKEKFVNMATADIVPLKHMKVVLYEGDSATETTTDSDGNYEITINDFQENKEYDLKIIFEYDIDHTTYFSIYFQNVPEPVSYTHTFKIRSDSDLTQDIKLDDIFTKENSGLSFIFLYLHTAEAFEFYKDKLGVNIDFQLPLYIFTYLTDAEGIKYRWENGRSFIDIDNKYSSWQCPDRPIREFHEVSHYIMHCLYRKMPEGINTPIKMVNHDGYVNPSTADSFSEGFAIFMSLVIAEYYNLLLSPYDFSTYGSIEHDYQPWQYKGKLEEGSIAGILWDLYDGESEFDLDRKKDLEYELYLFDMGESIYDSKEDIEEAFQNKQMDDDEVDLTLEQVWEILKVYHPDFYSVYNAFVTNFPDQKSEIDQIFIDHGFYADTGEGNGIFDSGEPSRGEYFVDLPGLIEYDEDEILGKATNYERPWRSGLVQIPGHFIKVDNSVPNYWLSYRYADKPYMTYYGQTKNINGNVYVFVPPEPYDVEITIEAAGVKTTNPLTISSTDFHKEYTNSVDQGYYKEHTFEFVGDIPSEPIIPDILFETDDNENNGSPGFEIILVICALTFILYYKRKKQK